MRMPSYSRSYEEWADYLIKSEMSVDDAIEKTSSEAVASWLDERRIEIEAIVAIKGTAVATFVTKGELVEDVSEFVEEVEEEAKSEDEQPAKGIRV